MGKRDLIQGVFEGRRQSRVPIGFWFHFLGEAETGDALADGSLFERSLEGHRRFIGDFKPDMVKVMSDGFFRFPLAGPVSSASDLPGAVRVLEPDHPWILRQAELLARVREADADNTYFYNVFSPLTTLRFTLGHPLLHCLLSESPDGAEEALLRLGESLARLSEAVIARGSADGVYLSVQNPDTARYSNDFYRRRVSPSELLVIERVKGLGGAVILHVCGYSGVRNDVPFFAGYGADAFNWAVNVEDVPLGAGRGLFPGKTLIGGFPNGPGSILCRGSREEIRRFTRDLISSAGAERLIIGADCTVPSDISLERLNWVREAAVLDPPSA